MKISNIIPVAACSLSLAVYLKDLIDCTVQRVSHLALSKLYIFLFFYFVVLLLLLSTLITLSFKMTLMQVYTFGPLIVCGSI